MDLIHDPSAFQRRALEWRAEGLTSALVPTMGALHEGHIRLIEEARRRAERIGVSLFVNPTQFAPGEDFEHYPRGFERDAEVCRARGVDVLFAPTHEDMYPEGFQTHVTVERLTGPLCGRTRPGHFQGVTTVVMKLLMLAQPTCAVFGWKDAQQFLVLRRMVRDLDVPVEMIGVETVREADGLAMSSRNAYLTDAERADAPLIYEGLCAARRAFEGGERGVDALLHAARAVMERSSRLEIEYLEARSLTTLETPRRAVSGDTLLAAAAHLGATRLIDNVRC